MQLSLSFQRIHAVLLGTELSLVSFLIDSSVMIRIYNIELWGLG